MSCYLADYLKEIGHIPLDLEDIKPGMRICFDHDKAYAQKVIYVKEDMIFLNHGMKVQFKEGEVYRYVE